ncbi:ATP-dependent RNA helicase DDX19A isoform X1 [Salmo salar]|uniref:RNA helicase n=2 Tax=Salmo salar TaxID=8030 RepID=A0A1S3LKT1_SALSA|nr:ATP-dependent RNA helicase DDX19A isoform X1 [Salmo salar]XP_029578619.1 ATP-dependent RNA helicase DDX19A-like isoform X1 [Salmo trutta]|eukprot:XP_013991572.1 PREDICTED: ATP-dependent RNA helicase DDX19A isoform X1 [Salmo salar]
MATDSWALAVDKQESTTDSFGSLVIRSPPRGDAPPNKAKKGTTKQVEDGTNVEGEEKEDKAAQSLLNKMIHTSLVNTTNQVEVLQRDPNSPLYSVKTFEELRLKDKLLKGVYDMGFNRPSKIQENALPMMLAEPVYYPSGSRPQNLIAQSQSGTGKTAAFVLAMLSHVDPTNKWAQCLCIAPTYELALQTGKVIEQMGKFYPEVKLAYAIRGNKLDRGAKLQEQIVIGTPGTVLDWCSKLKIINPKKISVFVLDEADVMIATQGHQDQSIRIQRMLPKECQMLLFSATFEDSVWKFAERVVPDPNIIKLKREEETLDTIKQYYVLCSDKEEKFTALCNIYGAITIAQAMIFCHTRRTAGWLAAELTKEGHVVALLSGEMTVEQRAAIIERFREGKEKVLVTTNVCSRGIDVEQVSVVINFDLPMDKYGNADNETYLHRIGRTGRFGKRGLAVNMIDSKHSMNILNQIEEHFNKKINKLDTDDLDEIEKISN